MKLLVAIMQACYTEGTRGENMRKKQIRAEKRN